MNKLFKVLLKTILGLVIFAGLYLLTAFLLSRITIQKEADTVQEIPIYILTNGVHTDIVVPIKNEFYDWSQNIKFENTVSKSTQFNYLAIGWGDKGFYLETPEWKDLKPSVAFKAAFALSNTAMHTTYYQTMEVGEDCRKIMLSKDQYQRLINYITNSFQKDKDGNYMHIETHAVYGEDDAFYDATGSYSLFKTCNTWANNALKACGQKCCFWTAFEKGIFEKYDLPD